MPDINFLSFANCEVGARQYDLLEAPAGDSDTLKFSNAWDGHIDIDILRGGLEDCCDANNGSHGIVVSAREWWSGGSYVVTTKGGCYNMGFHGCIMRHGTVTDLDFDNYSDQSHRPSGNIEVNMTTPDGSPIHWRSLKGMRPIFLNANEQKYVCDLFLPYPVGMAWDTFYHGLKIVHICK